MLPRDTCSYVRESSCLTRTDVNVAFSLQFVLADGAHMPLCCSRSYDFLTDASKVAQISFSFPQSCLLHVLVLSRTESIFLNLFKYL